MLKISIPFVDLRGRTPIDLLRSYPDRALSLVRAARRSYGMLSNGASLIALPVSDRRSHRWLRNNRNPYLYEIETFADILRARGVYTFNLHYEWSCTTGVYRTEETTTMLRVLDCPIPTLGQQVMVVLQSGRRGDFYNITWPGVSGVFTAMAPGRFAAAINKAPMRRHGLGYIGDWAKNRALASRQVALPPSHLLRQVMENAPDFAVAKHMLSHMPLAMPAIFILSGVRSGEGCIIERTEDTVSVREIMAEQHVCASNHFSDNFAASGKGWRPREPDSYGRLQQSANIYGHELEAEQFDWLQAPIINPHTRICVIADAATQRLMVQGYEGMAKATETFNMPAVESYAERWAI